jgi:toxin ParE1/3/4
MRLTITRLAQSDIDTVHDFIASDKPAAAIRWVQRMRDEFKYLAKNPGVGESREDVRPGLRSYSVGSYVVYFRNGTDALEVVRVLHGRRDVGMQF